MSRLNFHHLHYFWAVAKEGNLTRAAAHLHVSQSALSAQIRQLEEQLGQPLFARVGRSLQLTEAGQLALGYAESIFASGNELMALLREGRRDERQVLRIGAVATLSRNFQENFLRPLLERADVELVLQSGSLTDLLARLRGLWRLDYDPAGLAPLTADDEEVQRVTVGMLLEAGLIIPGQALGATFKKRPVAGTVTAAGEVEVRGVKHQSLSAAASAATGGSINGWDFWHTHHEGRRVPLKELRSQYLGTLGASTRRV